MTGAPSHGDVSASGRGDDQAAAFALDGAPVGGRIVRLGPAVDTILRAHDYPAPVAQLLGECLVLAVLVGASLKFEGRLLVQARGDGPVSLLVADYATQGGLRGYAKVDPDALDRVAAQTPRPGAADLIGAGQLAMTIDRGPDFDRYQSLVPLEGASLAEAAGAYFEASEQVPTRVALAVGEVMGDAHAGWRAGGAILQRVAGDAARGDTDEAWNTAAHLFETISADELLDPAISESDLLYRLFHEQGVRLSAAADVRAACQCSSDRVLTMLARFPAAELTDLVEGDGRIEVVCEFCGSAYRLLPTDVDAARERLK